MGTYIMIKRIKIILLKVKNFFGMEYWGLYEDQKIKLGLVKPDTYDMVLIVDGIHVPITKNGDIYKIDVGQYSLDFTRKLVEKLREIIKEE